MKDYRGFTIVLSDRNSIRLINEGIRNKRPFTDAVTIKEWRYKNREICIIIVDGKLKALCLARKESLVTTNKYKIAFLEFVDLNDIPVEYITETLDRRSKTNFINLIEKTAGRFSERAWDYILSSIKNVRPQVNDEIDQLVKKRLQKVYDGPNLEIESFSRDAVQMALFYSEIDHKESDFAFSSSNNSPIPSFMEGLDGNVSSENRTDYLESKILDHDVQSFLPHSLRLPSNINFTAQYIYKDKKLNVWKCDRENIEQQLGVDLIFYHEFYDAYIVVQYKRMHDEKGNYIFRPVGDTYKKELENMEKLELLINSDEVPDEDSDRNEVLDYRFHNGVCYFKICDPRPFSYSENEMIKGMYFSFDYWKKLISDERTIGPRAGRYVSYENSLRYFNNTQFRELIKNGWIGSKKNQSELITKVINEILKNKRSAIFAEFKSSK